MSHSMSPGSSETLLNRRFFRLTLFWKILGWFWLTMAIVITLFLFVGYVNSERAHYRPLPPHFESELERVTRRTSKLLQNDGSQLRLKARRSKDIYLLDDTGRDYFQRNVPELVADLHTRAKRRGLPMFGIERKQAFVGGAKISIANDEFWLYTRQRGPIPSGQFFRGFFKEFARILLFSIFIISFPLSFLLSWIITKPIRRLQKATFDIQKNLNNRKNLARLSERRDEFGELARDFDVMANHLQSMLESQKQLVSDVSHELRSPLTRLQVALELAHSSANNANQSQLQRIELEANRMNQMLDNLLTLSKLESAEIHTTNATFDLCQLIEIVVEDGRFEAEQHGIYFNLNLPETIEFVGNRESLISGIENIVRNAIRFAGDRGCITIEVVKTDSGLVLSISDTGPGVPETELPHLFDPFYRPDDDRARKSGGVGLGLSIAQRAFALNGGEIRAENIQPHGLRLTITFCN